jgi:transposase
MAADPPKPPDEPVRPRAADALWPWPFSPEDWDQVPASVRAYLLTLQRRLEALEERVNRNSTNSNQPPSTDGPFHAPRSRETKPHGKPGGRKGHKGHRRAFLTPTRIVDIRPSHCPDCGGSEFGETTPYHAEQQVELPPIEPEVNETRLHQGPCKNCGRMVRATRAQVPLLYRAGLGPRLTALVALMAGVLGASRRDIQRLLADVLGVPVSLGGLQKTLDRASAAVEPIYEAIAKRARSARVNHIDETSWRSQHHRRLRWLWVMANQAAAFFRLLPGRARKDFEALIDTWKGVLVSDDYGLYRTWVNLRQTCLAHLIRKAQKLAESTDADLAGFGRRVRAELKLACRMARPGHGPPTLGQWQAHYMRVVRLLFDHHERADEAGKLARALVRQLDSLWVFLEVHGVHPTNNHAERTLRFPVQLRRHGQGTKSDKGERWVERILSLRETSRLRGHSSFKILVDAVHAHFERRQPNLTWLSAP